MTHNIGIKDQNQGDAHLYNLNGQFFAINFQIWITVVG